MVTRQRLLSMVAEMAFAPVRPERRFGVAVAALAQLVDLAVHLPTLDRTTEAAAQGALHEPAGAFVAGVGRRDTAGRSAGVRQIRIGPAIQVAQALVGVHARQR